MPSKKWNPLIQTIYDLYGGRKIELDYMTSFQLLCAVILSAQTTDKQVNRITPPFFRKVREASDVISLSLEEIESDLKYVNFFRNKSRFIKETGTILAEKYDSILPNDLKLIQTFPGIGVKTAKVVLSVLYDMPYVWVDTHIHRVMNRIGIVTTKTPEETDREIERIFAIKQKMILHHAFVLFGRYACTAKKPKCETCPLQKKCAYYRYTFREKSP
jgi:endonuclease III